MPELPEEEALRRALDDPVRAFPIEHAGPAHVATLKTFDPPLAALDGRALSGAERRAKRLLFPTEDGELVLLIHLMSAGRVRYLAAGEAGPKAPAFRLRFEGGAQLVLTEAGPKKRAGVWLLTPEAVEQELAHLGPEALGLGPERLGEILARGAATAALAPPRPANHLRDRPRVGERDPPHRRPVPFRPGPGSDPGTGPCARGRDRLRAARGLELRERGAKDAKVYRVHNKLHEPCHLCATPIERVDFDEHTIYYCPSCQTGGRVLKDRRLSRLLR